MEWLPFAFASRAKAGMRGHPTGQVMRETSVLGSVAERGGWQRDDSGSGIPWARAAETWKRRGVRLAGRLDGRGELVVTLAANMPQAETGGESVLLRR